MQRVMPNVPLFGIHLLHSASVYSTGLATVAVKEHVESLHQTNKSSLLYGKNHVVVQLLSQHSFYYFFYLLYIVHNFFLLFVFVTLVPFHQGYYD